MKTIPFLLGLTFCGITVADGEPTDPSEKWVRSVEEFAREDGERGPLDGGVLFVGSSSIRMWPLDESFPDLETRNRGFGGSKTREVNELYDVLVAPHRPDQIVVYAGENDLAAGAEPEEVLAEWRRFADRTAEELPETRIIYLGIKRAPVRWTIWNEMVEVNELIGEDVAARADAIFVDTNEPILDAYGLPDLALFADGIHLNQFGDQLWSARLREVLGVPERSTEQD